MAVYAALLLIARRLSEDKGAAAIDVDQVLRFETGGFPAALGKPSVATMRSAHL